MQLIKHHRRHSSKKCKFGWRQEVVDSSSVVSMTGFTRGFNADPETTARLTISTHTLFLKRREVEALAKRFAEILSQ
jgi:hypothetical protein